MQEGVTELMQSNELAGAPIIAERERHEIATDLQILMCASLGTRSRHFIQKEDTCIALTVDMIVLLF